MRILEQGDHILKLLTINAMEEELESVRAKTIGPHKVKNISRLPISRMAFRIELKSLPQTYQLRN